MSQNLIMPGDYIGTEEEYIPGKCVYTENGKLFSSCIGKLQIDKSYEANVVPLEEEIKLKFGDEVIGVVTDINEPLIIIQTEYILRDRKLIPHGERVLLHASRVFGRYINEAGKFVKIRDVVKGRVTSIAPGRIDISIERPEDGVILAHCMKCRKPLEKVNNGLYCSYCQRTELRKLANMYGSEVLLKKVMKIENR